MRLNKLCVIGLLISSTTVHGAEPLLLKCTGVTAWKAIDAPSDAYIPESSTGQQDIVIEDSQMHFRDENTSFALCKSSEFTKNFSSSCDLTREEYISNFRTITKKMDFERMTKIPLGLLKFEIDKTTLGVRWIDIAGYVRTSFTESKPQWTVFFTESEFRGSCEKVKPVM